jgi:ubiquinone/menaquinone biosynthesis C-methylase UbiE
VDENMIEKNLRSVSDTKKSYDSHASLYDIVRYGTPGGRYVYNLERKFAAKLVKGPKVLEVGTATGRFATLFSTNGFEYTGVDISNRMLRITSEKVKALGGDLQTVQMDGCRLSFNQYFDDVVCIRTFHFLPEPLNALQGMQNALAKEGKCLVSFESDNLIRRLAIFVGVGNANQRYYRYGDVEDMLLKTGFKVLRSGSVMRIPVTFYRRCPRSLLWILSRLERLWPWPMHEFVLGVKPQAS